MMEEQRQKLKIYCFQRRIIASQIYGDSAIEEIKTAFSDNEYPGDENLVASSKHLAECDECRSYYDFFVGKKWQECLTEESYKKLCGGQSFFKSVAWHYYLPAFLIQCFEKAKFSSFHFSPIRDSDLDDEYFLNQQNERINLLSSKQCEVIVNYLEITLEVWKGIEKGFEDDLKPLEFWKSNYWKTLERERNLDEL